MADYYVKSGAGAAQFVQSNAYSSGQKMVPKRASATIYVDPSATVG